jgi:ribonucleoside-diphosphate reductase beta chain
MSAPLHTAQSGLDRRLVPYQLWQKAKKLGTWDPDDIDLDPDRADWRALDARERDLLLRLTAQFEGGEESVTRHLVPLLRRVAADGPLEEELFLTSYLWEEAKHVEGFDRFLRTVAEAPGDLDRFFTPPYRTLLFEELPSALDRLDTDDRPEALASASVTYQMIVEGVLAETGYAAYQTVLEARGIMPGMQRLVGLVQRDESRHVAYGVYLLSRLVAEHGDRVWSVIEERMDTLLPLVLNHIRLTLDEYDAPLPFGVSVGQFLEIGQAQFTKRLQRIETARGQSLEDVLYASSAAPREAAPGTRRPAPPPQARDDA